MKENNPINNEKNETATIEDAISIAALAHRSMKDKTGAPYIFHTLGMMIHVKS
jgi:(p)ppGpp synthase/HD superfamily hydrolase